MDPGGAVLDQPELGGERDSVLAGDPEPKRAGRAFLLGQGAEEGRRAFLGLPAGGIDRFVSGPGRFVEAGVDLDVEPGRLGLALGGVAQLAGPGRPISVEILAVRVDPPGGGGRAGEGRPAGAAEGPGQRLGVFEGKDFEPVQPLAQRPCDRLGARGVADQAEAKAVPAAQRLASAALVGKEQPGRALAVARPRDQRPSGRRAMRLDQPEPAEPVEQAGAVVEAPPASAAAASRLSNSSTSKPNALSPWLPAQPPCCGAPRRQGASPGSDALVRSTTSPSRAHPALRPC